MWLSWDQILKSERGGLVLHESVGEEICHKKSSQKLLVFGMRLTYRESKELCQSIDGQMVHSTNIREINEAIKGADLKLGNLEMI